MAKWKHALTGAVLETENAVSIAQFSGNPARYIPVDAAAKKLSKSVDSAVDEDGELSAMTAAELKEIAREEGISFPGNAAKKDLIRMITDARAADTGADAGAGIDADGDSLDEELRRLNGADAG